MIYEAFIYLWYDALNKMFYLGKHKGSPDDSYTHSSTIWEHFTKDNIPKGVTRRILAYGTHEEMCILEHKLLINRKKRCWNRYYNESLGDPRYVDMSGENAWNWKGGITYDWKAYQKEYHKEYQQSKEYKKAYRQTPKYKEYNKAYRQTPERREVDKAYHKKYDAERYARKKAGTQGVGTLEGFI